MDYAEVMAIAQKVAEINKEALPGQSGQVWAILPSDQISLLANAPETVVVKVDAWVGNTLQ